MKRPIFRYQTFARRLLADQSPGFNLILPACIFKNGRKRQYMTLSFIVKISISRLPILIC